MKVLRVPPITATGREIIVKSGSLQLMAAERSTTLRLSEVDTALFEGNPATFCAPIFKLKTIGCSHLAFVSQNPPGRAPTTARTRTEPAVDTMLLPLELSPLSKAASRDKSIHRGDQLSALTHCLDVYAHCVCTAWWIPCDKSSQGDSLSCLLVCDVPPLRKPQTHANVPAILIHSFLCPLIW